MRAKRFGFGASTWLLVLALFCAAGSAHAQATPKPREGEHVDGDIKGTIGLGLIGMEAGLLLTPLFGLQKETWAWVAFPVIGAAGGIVGGIFAFEQPGDADPKVTVPILAAGMALVIPAVVGALALKSNRDANELEMDMQGSGAVQFGKNGTRLRVPSVAVGQVYSPSEQLKYGVSQRAQYSVSLFSGRF